MHRATPRTATLLLLGAAVLVAGGCDAGTGRVATGGSSPAASSTTASPPPSFATTTTAAPATSTTRRGGSTSTSTSTTARPATTSTAPRPREVVPKPGDRVVAVFVATGASLADPSFAKAKARLTALGYRGHTGGDTSCSRGAKEALPQLRAYSLSLEFATGADAARFASLYGTVLGTVSVTVFCVD